MSIQSETTTTEVPQLDLRRKPSLKMPVGTSKVKRTILNIVGLVLGIIWVIPLLWIILVSFKPMGSNVMTVKSWLTPPYTIHNYIQAFQQAPVLVWILNSFLIALITTFFVLLLSVLCAFPLSRNRFPGRSFLLFLLAIGLMVPGEALLIPLFILFHNLHMLNSYYCIILPGIAVPFGVFMIKQFFDGLPNNLFDAAKMDGCGTLRMIFTVAVPLSRPALVALGIFTFLSSWNNFLWPYISIVSPHLMTVPVGIPFFNSTYHTDYTLPAAGNVIVSLPVIIVYLIFQRQITKGFAFSSLK
jgi:multiple sugar transport system permease protein